MALLQFLDWFWIIAFLIISLLISLAYRRRASKSIQDFFLGGRNLPWYVAGLSMVATTFAADTPLAVTELTATQGIAGNWIWWCFISGGMLTVFFFAPLWRRAGILTEVELIELRYGGKPAAFLRAVKAFYLGAFMNVLIIGWVNLALMTLLQVMFDTNHQTLYLVTGLLMSIAIFYSVLSGLWGVAVADVFQFVMAMTGTIFLAYFVVSSEQIGGLSGLVEKVPPDMLQFWPSFSDYPVGDVFTISLASFIAYAGIQWWASWYPGAEPGGGGYIAQRIMSTPNDQSAVKSVLLFQIAHYCIRPWPWILVALSTTVLYPELAVDEKRLGYVYAIRDFMPVGWKGLLIAAFFAAYMSTISTQINWGAGCLVNDIYLRFMHPKASQSRQILFSRLFTALLALAGWAVSTQIRSISGVWSFILECGAGTGLVLILRWYWWRINVYSEIIATVAPFFWYAMAHFVFQWTFPNSFFFTVGCTTISWLIVTFITAPEPLSVLQRFVDRVRPMGFWKGMTTYKPHIPIDWWLLWLAAIIFTYSVLFFLGSILFSHHISLWIYGFSGLGSGIYLWRQLYATNWVRD